eukprot:693532-Prorocentrum_minimum.AAC.3
MVALYARPKQLAVAAGKQVWEVGEEEGEGAQLQRAHALIRTQDAEMAELRGRNAQLAERLISMVKGAGVEGGAEGGGKGGAGAVQEADLEAAAEVC